MRKILIAVAMLVCSTTAYAGEKTKLWYPEVWVSRGDGQGVSIWHKPPVKTKAECRAIGKAFVANSDRLKLHRADPMLAGFHCSTRKPK